jgi:hypothetical protein
MYQSALVKFKGSSMMAEQWVWRKAIKTSRARYI